MTVREREDWWVYAALLKAIAEKLIPGIPEETRVVLLQQTHLSDANTEDETHASESSIRSQGPTVLEEVIERATSKAEVQQEINSQYVPHSFAQPLS
jgi:hypothetical protein